jgi:hypothetical protein
MRIKGWLGRADQTTKIRGMFVHPSQVADITRRFPEIVKARLVVSGEMANDVMTLKVEANGAPQGLDARIGDAVRGRDQAACRGPAGAAGQPAERRQGHRGRNAATSRHRLDTRPGCALPPNYEKSSFPD